MQSSTRTKLMWASFLTLVASGVGFATRAASAGVWEGQFNIGGQQFGAIMGAGFLGFGMMIFFGGILTEKFGYKKLLVAAFVLHLISAGMIFFARPTYSSVIETSPETATSSAFNFLFWSAFLFSIAQGIYEAVINPLIAQLYEKNQTHYLNILHAGWPLGIIIGGLVAYAFIGKNAVIMEVTYWEIPLTSFALLVLAYGVLAFPIEFPKTVSAKSKQSFAVLFSCFLSPVFILLMLLHACIGYVELGVDSWVTKLMQNLLPNAVLILIYTSFLMFILRFFAGPIVHKINPIGLLFVSSVLACGGLFWLGSDITSVAVIFAAATVYSLGKAFFWPTMLGVAGERYPQCGAIAMGALGAMGMLTVGLIANEAIGYKQAANASANLEEKAPPTFERYAEHDKKRFLFLPEYRRLTPSWVNAANGTPKLETGELDMTAFDKLRNGVVTQIGKAQQDSAKTSLQNELEKVDVLIAKANEDVLPVQDATIYGGRRALTITAYVPAIMAVGYLVLLVYFASIGGYKRVEFVEPDPDKKGNGKE